MNFEKGLDPKTAIGIGMDKIIIQRLDAEVRKMNPAIRFKEKNNDSRRLASWINPHGGYVSLIKVERPQFDCETKYPNYYIEWDSGSSFANDTIDSWIGDVHHQCEKDSPWYEIALS